MPLHLSGVCLPKWQTCCHIYILSNIVVQTIKDHITSLQSHQFSVTHTRMPRNMSNPATPGNKNHPGDSGAQYIPDSSSWSSSASTKTLLPVPASWASSYSSTHPSTSLSVCSDGSDLHILVRKVQFCVFSTELGCYVCWACLKDYIAHMLNSGG